MQKSGYLVLRRAQPDKLWTFAEPAPKRLATGISRDVLTTRHSFLLARTVRCAFQPTLSNLRVLLPVPIARRYHFTARSVLNRLDVDW